MEQAAGVTFRTSDGVEVPAVSADRMWKIDQIAMQETGPNMFQMMENAGRNLASLSMEVLKKDWRKSQIITLAGAGGNGGGGICAARHLANRGAEVVLCLSQAGRLAEVSAFQLKIFRSSHGREVGPQELKAFTPDLILDALIGYNLQGTPRGTARELICWANQTGTPIVSLDVPSGLDATTGDTPGEAIRARWTITLALPKTGLSNAQCGDLVLADIGIPPTVFQRMELSYIAPFGSRFRVPLYRSGEGL